MRAIGLNVHRDFCEVAIVEDGVVRSAGRVATTPETLGLFARSLGREDRVALEVTGNASPAGHGAPDPQFEITSGWKSVRIVVDVGGGTGQAAERFARCFGHTNLHSHSIDHRRHRDRAQRGFSPHRPGAWRPPTTSRLVEARGTTHSRPRR